MRWFNFLSAITLKLITVGCLIRWRVVAAGWSTTPACGRTTLLQILIVRVVRIAQHMLEVEVRLAQVAGGRVATAMPTARVLLLCRVLLIIFITIFSSCSYVMRRRFIYFITITKVWGRTEIIRTNWERFLLVILWLMLSVVWATT